jgi:adenine-specific DNA-methyltransferase
MEKMKMETANITDENIRKIEALFPNCITETVDGDGNGRKVINFELLRQMLSTDIVEGEETYEFTWVGKKAAIIEANRPTRKTLRPVIEESLDWGTTGNLYLEGDNLEVLKLLQESYLGKVKMIYIDPPYNTGSDFVYPDSFVMTSEDYNEGTGYFDEDGNVNFSRENGAGAARYHSDWCSMMYSRLMLARNLLAEDGAMFISIDDNESTNLTKICDELFGEANRIALICHKSRASVSNDKIISPNHNTILFYAKNIVVLENRRKMIGLDPVLDGFDYDDNDGRGEYRLVPVDGPGGAKKGNPHYEFLGVEGYWRFSKETMQKKYEDGLVVKRGNSLYQKYYKSTAAKTRKTATTWWDDAGLMSTATSRLKSLMGEATFDTPKPLELIDRMLRMITFEDKDSIVLDFFAGSSTTAHALMQYNAETEGNRKFILVQLPEPCAEKSEAKQNGWNDICEIGRERIKRAGKQIKTEYPAIADKLDVGFRVFKLDESNMNDVYYSAGEYTQGLLSMLESNVKSDRSDLDLLFGCLLEWGLPLSMPYTSEKIEGCTVHTYNEGDLIACFDENIPDSVIKEIAKRQPLRAVFRDSSFNGSPAKINVGEIFKMLAPDTRVKVI